jgi:hypothetical protein
MVDRVVLGLFSTRNPSFHLSALFLQDSGLVISHITDALSSEQLSAATEQQAERFVLHITVFCHLQPFFTPLLEQFDCCKLQKKIKTYMNLVTSGRQSFERNIVVYTTQLPYNSAAGTFSQDGADFVQGHRKRWTGFETAIT